jgi:hypothetical protein
MDEKNLENFMKLVTDNRGKNGEESQSDRYYRLVYERHLNGEKFIWNWAAALGNFYWFIYRKMYAMAWLSSIIVGFTVGVFAFLIAFLLNAPDAQMLDAPREVTDAVLGSLKISKHIAISLLILIILVFVALGFLGNYLYIRHIHKKINQGYHCVQRRNVDWWTFTLFWAVPLISLIENSYNLMVHGVLVVQIDYHNEDLQFINIIIYK